VGIHGPGGEVKTSVLNMIIERLETYENVVVVRFNPWRFPEESLLLRSFFLDVAGKIDSALLTKKETLVALAEEYAPCDNSPAQDFRMTNLPPAHLRVP